MTQTQLPVATHGRTLRRMRKKSAVQKHSRGAWLDVVLDMVRPRKSRPKKIVKRLVLQNPAVSAEQEALKHLSCMCSVVALHAHLAKLRGNISAKGFLEFRCLFPIGDAESKNLRYLFKLAWEDIQTMEYHVMHIMSLYPDKRQMYQRIADGLARQMLAADEPHRHEIQWLQDVAEHFALTRFSVRQILDRAEKPLEASPYWLFNLPKNASKERIQQAYKKMMMKCHPDKVHAAHYPETIAAAEKISTAATLAYGSLKRRKSKRLRISA